MENKIYDLTNPQKSILLTEQFYPNTSINNISGTLLLEGKINKEILKKAINIFILKNDGMRIRVKNESNLVKQYIKEYKEKEIEEIHFKNKMEFENWKREVALKPFEFYDNDLYKFYIVITNENEIGFNITAHHLISDAWSMSLLVRNIVRYYYELKNNLKINKEKEESYIDFINKEKEYKSSSKYEKDKEYWKKVYIEEKERKTFHSTVGKREKFVISKNRNMKIMKFCKEHRISPFVLFISILFIYFYKINKREIQTIGTPILNRSNYRDKNTIGMYISTIPFGIKIKDNMKFIDFLSYISKEQYTLFKHQKLPYQDIQEIVKEKGVHTLFDVILSYQNAKFQEEKNEEMNYTIQWEFCGHIAHDLDIHICELTSNVLEVLYDYNLDCFTNIQIQNLHKNLEILTDTLIEKPQTILDEIEIESITENEKDLIFNDFNNTGEKKITKTVIDIFDEIANKYPQNIAVKVKNKEITYKDLQKQANYIASILIKEGVKKNQPIAMLFEKSPEMIVSMLAIMKAGGCYVPVELPPECPLETIEYILKDSNSKILLTHNGYEKQIKKKITTIDIRKKIKEYKNEFIEVENKNQPNDYQSILYTSGTTGNPKGTITIHKNIVNLRESLKDMQEFHPTQKDVSIASLSYSFDGFGLQLFLTLLYGGKSIIVEKNISVTKYIEIMKKEKVSILFNTVVYIYELTKQLETANKKDFDHLRWIMTGGELVKTNKFIKFKEKFSKVELFNVYGPTETGMICFYNPISKQDMIDNNGTIGRPLKYCKAVVVNKNNEIVPLDTKGELLLYGDNIGKGYLNLADLTKQKFIKVPFVNQKAYKTGDVVKLNKDMRIDFIGREDNRVKIKGNLVEIDGIEKIISELECIHEVYVIIVKEEKMEIKDLVAFVISDEKEKQIKQVLYEKMRPYMIPKYIFNLKEIPKNKNGKVDRKVLTSVAEEKIQELKKHRRNNIVLPQNETQKVIYNIIKKMTSFKNISIQDDLFDDLYFDSLMSIELSTKLGNKKIYISPQDIYDNPNIKQLAKLVQTSSEKERNQIDTQLIQKYSNVEVYNNASKPNLKNILITGVTGFLGAHLLMELLNELEITKIYCVIREKYNKSGLERLKMTLKYYFNIDFTKELEKKVVVLNGDITEDYLGLDIDEYNLLSKKITTVINTAANVKHIGKYKRFYKDNVQSTINLLELCKRSKASFMHMSTLSVCGYIKKEEKEFLFTEDMINEGQSFLNNPYIESKFEAECKVLEYAKELNVKIFRLGNIMMRYEDGAFQKNVKDSGFIHMLKGIVKDKLITQEILNQYTDISPVDKCSQSIMKIMKTEDNANIYHIINNHYIQFGDLFSKIGIVLKKVPSYKLEEKYLNENDIGVQYIKNRFLNKKYKTIQYDISKTIKLLEIQKFYWPELKEIYIEKLLKYII